MFFVFVVYFNLMANNKILDLRYHEMWETWNGPGQDDYPTPPFKRELVLSWKQLNVTVRKKIPKFFGASQVVEIPILKNVSGNVECGTLLGIMGPSGSGKTTLMATISHRTKGNFSGQLLINGRSVSEDEMIKISGFVAQEDISFVQLTVWEQLMFIARLKLDRNTSKTVINDRINYMVAHLGLNEIISSRLCSLSGGERKKVALALQLIHDPPILFCDEITTGLDSYWAAHVIKTLRRVAHSGKIVICTIHQPASGVFDQFQEVILLTNGQLAYHGSVYLVNDFFQKYGYICPATYNKAEFIVSILNSDAVIDKNNVNNMCELSSTVTQMGINYSSFNKDVQSEYGHHLQVQNIDWMAQMLLLLYRCFTCFIRNRKQKLLDLGSLMILGVFRSSVYANIQFDNNFVQNMQGFWSSLVLSTVFTLCFFGIRVHQIQFSVVHREVSNKMYSLSAYYVSETIISIIWLMIMVIIYCNLVFWIVGINWTYEQLSVFMIVAIASYMYGVMLSAFLNSIEEAVLLAQLYDYIGMTVSGAYISLRSIPKVLFHLRYFSLIFLGCETMSSEFWRRITFLPCADGSNCLPNGEAVLMKYDYASSNLTLDVMILLIFIVSANILGYFGILRRMKKQPAY